MRIQAFKKIIKLISILITLIVLTNFVIITTCVYEYKDCYVVEKVGENAFSQRLKNKNVEIYLSDCSAKVVDCHKLSKEERIEVACFIVDYLTINNIECDRTVNNFVAEISLHSYLYKLGIAESSTKDADLEFNEDSRWYVRTGTLFFQLFGI